MRSIPTQLQTLPPDGTVLEELIGAMQSEYGTPTTPQEYRLIIKVPAPEEVTDPALEAPPEVARAEVKVAPPEQEVVPRTPRPTRRRRRGRRRVPGAALERTEAVSDEVTDAIAAEVDGEEG